MKRFDLIAQHYLLIISILTIAVFVQGCSGDTENELGSSARLIVTLIDSPAEYREVNVDIQEISLKTNGISENEGWIKLDKFTPGVYNILEFTGGQELPLADMEFPSGMITQIKLKLGDNNTLTIGSHTSTLLLAGGSADGFKFNVNESIKDASTHYLRIDFDAARSVTNLGNTGQMLLKPVIRLFSENSTGSVSGYIDPAEKNILVNVISNNQIIASSYAPENFSKFFIPGIEPGIYDLSFESNEGSYQKYVRDITVSVGQTTDIGKVRIFEIEKEDDD
jgi:hypothetical protein